MPESIGATRHETETWSILFERQVVGLQGKACDEFLDGVAVLGLDAEIIPTFSELGDRLEEASGWRIDPVDGQLSGRDYWQLIGNKRFPVVPTLRGRDELDHAREPDFFHDVFGHIPLLTHPPYSAFLRDMSTIALQRIDDKTALKKIGRIYKWTIEYGLIDTPAGLRVYGAGLASSSKEIEHVFRDDVAKLPYEPRTVLLTPHTPASLQDAYFVISSFDQLLQTFPEVEALVFQTAQDGPLG